MKFTLNILLFFFSLNIFASDFRTFDDYKNNNALLSSDIERLEAMVSTHQELIYSEMLKQLKLILVNYERMNPRLSLNALMKDMSENGMQVTSKKIKDLIPFCEGEKMNKEQCVVKLNELIFFISQSNLAPDEKVSINSFIDSYLVELKHLAVFDQAFISSFNANISKLNQLETKNKVYPIVVKVIPLKGALPQKRVAQPKQANLPAKIFLNNTLRDWFELLKNDWKAIGLFVFVLLTFFSFRIFYKRKTKKDSVELVYARLFNIAQKNKIQIRLFGHIHFEEVGPFGKIEKPLLESLYHLKSAIPEIHIKFKRRKKEFKIEALFLSNRSISSLKENVLIEKIDYLQNAVSVSGGQLNFTNYFNTKGEIINSNLNIVLPLK